MVRHAPFAALVLLVALTCGACGSVPDLHFADDGGTGEGGNDGGPCVKTGPEICDDGIDNDCNGSTDCEDAACTPTFSCQDAPAGWTAVAFAAAARPRCPTGTTATDVKAVSGDGSSSCSCTCGASGGTCAGDLTLTLTTENTCGVGPKTASIPVKAACTALAGDVNLPVGAFAKAAPASCAPNAAVVGGAPTNARICQSPRFGKGCAFNQVCVPKPMGLTSCVTQAGMNACPTGFSERSTAGASATDGRTCTGCTCALGAACTGGSVSVYDNPMCKVNGANQGAEGISGTCAATTDSGFVATHFKSTAATGGCGAPTVQATAGGALTFTEPRTVCCK